MVGINTPAPVPLIRTTLRYDLHYLQCSPAEVSRVSLHGTLLAYFLHCARGRCPIPVTGFLSFPVLLSQSPEGFFSHLYKSLCENLLLDKLL